MASPNTDAEQLPIRLTTVSVVLHGLLAILKAKGLLVPADVTEIELFALDLARDHKGYTTSDPQVAGGHMEQDVRSFFSALITDNDTQPESEQS